LAAVRTVRGEETEERALSMIDIAVTFTRWSRRSRRVAPWLGAVLVGCASGGTQSEVEGPSSVAESDGLRVLALNERLDATARSVASSPSADPYAEYRLGADDQIQIDVFGAEAFSGTHRIEASGEIALPLLGPVVAGGKTLREFEAHLEERLGESYMRDPHVTVQVVEMLSRSVSVIGPVGAPGVYQISGSKSLLEVLAMAEGLTEEAGSRVSVVRRPGQAAPGQDIPPAGLAEPHVIEVDLTALLDGTDASRNVLVQPGDIIQVHAAGYVYVVGQVNRPGGFTIPAGEGITVLQALAMAEGFTNTAAASESVIVREGNGEREEIEVNLDDVLEGSTPPPALRPSDILFIPNNDAKSFTLGAVNALVRMVTLRGLFY
jgi:polysaccharide export outer membrane protein